MRVAGHMTFASFDLFQVEIDSPYSGLRDGYYNDFGGLPEKYWYVKGNQITKSCRMRSSGSRIHSRGIRLGRRTALES
jgi:1,4-alpha-glucan branching enzyme